MDKITALNWNLWDWKHFSSVLPGWKRGHWIRLLENQCHLLPPKRCSQDCPWLSVAQGRCVSMGQQGWPPHALGSSLILSSTEAPDYRNVSLHLPFLNSPVHLLSWALSSTWQSLGGHICPTVPMVWKDKLELPHICLFLLLTSPPPQPSYSPLLSIRQVFTAPGRLRKWLREKKIGKSYWKLKGLIMQSFMQTTLLLPWRTGLEEGSEKSPQHNLAHAWFWMCYMVITGTYRSLHILFV